MVNNRYMVMAGYKIRYASTIEGAFNELQKHIYITIPTYNRLKADLTAFGECTAVYGFSSVTITDIQKNVT